MYPFILSFILSTSSHNLIDLALFPSALCTDAQMRLDFLSNLLHCRTRADAHPS